MKNAKQHFLDRKTKRSEMLRKRFANMQAKRIGKHWSQKDDWDQGACVRINLEVMTSIPLSNSQLLELVKTELNGPWVLSRDGKKYPVKLKVKELV